MIGPTLDEIIARVRSEMSEGDPGFFTDPDLTKAINGGQDAIATDCPWTAMGSYTTTTVIGSARYALPLAVIHPTATYLSLASGQEYRVDYTEPNIVDSRTSFSGSQRGVARWVTYRRTAQGVSLELFPGPSQSGLALRTEANIRPGTLVAAGDRTDLDPLVITVLVDYVLWKLKGKDEETQQAREYRDSYETGLRDLRARRLKSQNDQKNVNLARRSIFRWRGW